MIDYFCKWNTEAAAKQDAMRLRNYFGTDGGTIIKDWYLHQFLPNVKAWRPSLDVIGPPPDNIITHTYITGWLGILSLDHVENVILNDNSIAFVLDRDGGAGVPYVIKNNIGGIINDIAVAPVFAGSHYPLGGFS